MSGRRDGGFVRTERLMEIARRIAFIINNSPDKKCGVEDLVTWIQFNIGLTQKRAENYVGVVVKAKRWVLKDGWISYEEETNHL